MIEVRGESYNDVIRRRHQFRVEITISNDEDRKFNNIKGEFGKQENDDCYILKLIIEKGLTELGLEASKDDYFKLNEDAITKEVNFTPSKRGLGKLVALMNPDWIENYNRMINSALKLIAIERETNDEHQ